MSKALPERQLEIEGLLKELEKLDDLSMWASRTRGKLEQSPEGPPPKVGDGIIIYDCMKCRPDFFVCVPLLHQLIEEVQVRQPEVERVLERAEELYRDAPLEQADKVRKADAFKKNRKMN